MAIVGELSREMKRAFSRARESQRYIGIYTKPLFATRNEEQNITEIARLQDDEQDLVGIGIL
jgi:hypothetical protein